MRIVALLLALVSGVATAAPKDELERFVADVRTLSADFEQVQKDERGGVLQSSSGKLWLARPGKFRWNYEKPYQQLVVCDGETLWLHDPDLAQVTVRPAGATLQGTPAQLLTDPAALDRHFRAENVAGKDPHVRLVPKSADSDFRSVELWFKGAAPERMRFHDQLGGVTDVRFRAVQRDARPDPGLFTFVVPKNTEVIQAADTPASGGGRSRP